MSAASPPLSPYKGLMPFLEGDAAFFFGREPEREIISANLHTRRLTVLYGPSGVGKTSVINAGVVPELRGLMQKQQLARASSLAGKIAQSPVVPNKAGTTLLAAGTEVATVVVVFNHWIGDPQRSLQDAILAELRESELVVKLKTQQELRALSLTQMLHRLTTSEDGLELLIILDQFEEYFVYHPYDEGPGEFDDELARAVMRPDLHANFLISIREDWLSRLDRFKGRIPNLFENSIRIDHLKRKEAHEAIERPIEEYNRLIDEGAADDKRAKVTIEKGFTREALDQLAQLDEPVEASLNSREVKLEDRPIQTSRLQLVLDYFWGKIKDETQPMLGLHLLSKPDTVEHIFQLHLEESLAHLNEKERIVAANFLGFIITPSGKKFASTAKELAARCGGAPVEIAFLLDKLSKADVGVLNVVAAPPGHHYVETHYEIKSDVLADAILDWVKVMRGQQRRKESISKKFRNAFIVVLGLLLIFIALALVNALRQRRRLESTQNELQVEQRKLKGALDVARKLDKNVAVLIGHTREVTSAVFTQDGHVLTASVDHSAILWDINPVRQVQDFIKNAKDEKPLILARINPQGNLVLTASTDGVVRLWKVGVKEGPTQLRERVGQHVTDLSFSPSGDIIAASNTAGALMIWSTATRSLIKEIPGNGKAIRQISFSPTGNLLAAASEDHTVRIWRGSDWSSATVLQGHTDEVNGIAFSPNEEFIASAGGDRTVRVWKLSNGAQHVFSGHTASVNSVDFNSDGKRLLSASDDTTARIWDVETGKSKQLIGHTDKVLSASFSPSGLHAVTAGKDNSARIWSVATGEVLVLLSGHVEEITYVTYSKDGKYVLTASDDATARVWAAPESGPLEILQPAIEAKPFFHRGPCPVTINFVAKITARAGSGRIIYRFKGSDGRIGPRTELKFEEPGFRFVGWYWRITDDYAGSETIEILEPKGIKEQKAKFQVICRNVTNVSGAPSPSPTPASESPSP